MANIATYAAYSAGNPQIIITAPTATDKQFKGGVKFYNVNAEYTLAGKTRKSMFISFGATTPLNTQCMGATVFGSDDGSVDLTKAKRASMSIRQTALPELYSYCESVSNAVRAWANKHSQILFRQATMPEDRYHGLTTTHYSLQSRDPTKAGQELSEPLCRLKISFERYSERFTLLANRPKTTIFDWSTRRLSQSNGRVIETFEPATDAKGETMCARNINDIVRPNDTIRRIIAGVDGISMSQYGLSVRCIIYQLYIEHTGGIDLEPDMTPEEIEITKNMQQTQLREIESEPIPPFVQPIAANAQLVSAMPPPPAAPSMAAAAPIEEEMYDEDDSEYDIEPAVVIPPKRATRGARK